MEARCESRGQLVVFSLFSSFRIDFGRRVSSL